MNQKQKDARREWLKAGKQVVECLMSIDAELNRICPRLGGQTGKDRRDTLRNICRLSENIESETAKMSRLEGSGGFGFKAALGFDPYGDGTLTATLILILLARADTNVARAAYAVSDICTLVARRDPEVAVMVRSYWREDGPLYRYCLIGRAATLDESSIRMRESVWNSIMGLPAGDRTERLAEAEGLVGKNR